LTALADGALVESRSRAMKAHVAECADCTREFHSLARTVELSRHHLAAFPELRPGFATRLNARLSDLRQQPERRPAWRWWRPAFVGGLAAAGVLVMASSVGGPSAVLVPLGLQAPPKQVVEKPQLFKEYEIIEHLEELDHFDTVIQTPLEDEILGQRQGAG
jgi:anti-sigma factor RsiW